jgi:F-type H+-transporting ATPase subunit epsilon
MADTLHFSLVSPERELFSGDVKQVDAPGVEGEFGVLPKHAPFMTVLKPGVVRIHEDTGVTPVFVRGGFADVTPAGLTILAEEAVRLADVDATDIDAQIVRVRSDANDPGDETRRKRAAERLVYLEALRAALN